MNHNSDSTFKVFIIAGEESGDQLGASLMEGLTGLASESLSFAGVGGERMKRLGFKSIFPLEDIAVMGLTAVIRRLPSIVSRINQTAKAVIAESPDVLVIIDSPDFTHRVAKKVRKTDPSIPVVNYVSPSVWAWRPNRARKMAGYIDQVLCILPFEVEVHKRLGGPKCDYVGHPLLDKIGSIIPSSHSERPKISQSDRPLLLVMPGSRISEISRLLNPFRATLEAVLLQHPNIEIVLPAVPHLEQPIREQTSNWQFKFKIIVGEDEKFRAFRRAHAALAASGTASLELALSGIPMVIAYKVDWIYKIILLLNKFIPIGHIDSMVLPNIILGRNIVPEFLNESVTSENMAPKLTALLTNSAARNEQLQAFKDLNDLMAPENRESQKKLAAALTLQTVKSRSAIVST